MNTDGKTETVRLIQARIDELERAGQTSERLGGASPEQTATVVAFSERRQALLHLLAQAIEVEHAARHGEV